MNEAEFEEMRRDHDALRELGLGRISREIGNVRNLPVWVAANDRRSLSRIDGLGPAAVVAIETALGRLGYDTTSVRWRRRFGRPLRERSGRVLAALRAGHRLKDIAVLEGVTFARVSQIAASALRREPGEDAAAILTAPAERAGGSTVMVVDGYPTSDQEPPVQEWTPDMQWREIANAGLTAESA